MEACGCGEEQIPWMLAEFGLLGTAGLVLGVLVVMIGAGWLLATVVWLIGKRTASRRRVAGPVDRPPTTGDDAWTGPLSGFAWRDEDP